MTRVSYTVDVHDQIIEVGGAWRAFAEANDGGAIADGVIGRSLWDFVQGATVRHLYQRLLTRVRAGFMVQVSMRCDAPHARRDFMLTLEPLADGAVRFEGDIVRESLRSPVVLRGDRPLRLCGWCARVWMNGGWVELEDAVERQSLLRQHAPLPDVTHGICETCLAGIELPG